MSEVGKTLEWCEVKQVKPLVMFWGFNFKCFVAIATDLSSVVVVSVGVVGNFNL